jgi:hypothetical protein
MNLDDQLAELLARLGVALEDEAPGSGTRAETDTSIASSPRFTFGGVSHLDDGQAETAISGPPEVSLFQTSREHYGVFYRLDLAESLPQLRVFIPDDLGTLKMRCYLVRAAPDTPLHDWFVRARTHNGSPAYQDARDVAQQHLLFATGELMKRLFWGGDLEHMAFPSEIEVLRLI